MCDALIDGRDGKARCALGRRQMPQVDVDQMLLRDLQEWWNRAAKQPLIQQWNRFGSCLPALHQLRKTALLHSGLADVAAQDYQRACWAFERLTELRPASPTPAINLAYCYATAGDREAARVALRRAVHNGLTYADLASDPALAQLFDASDAVVTPSHKQNNRGVCEKMSIESAT